MIKLGRLDLLDSHDSHEWGTDVSHWWAMDTSSPCISTWSSSARVTAWCKSAESMTARGENANRSYCTCACVCVRAYSVRMMQLTCPGQFSDVELRVWVKKYFGLLNSRFCFSIHERMRSTATGCVTTTALGPM